METTALKYTATVSLIPRPCYGCNTLSHDLYKVYLPSDEGVGYVSRLLCQACFDKVKGDLDDSKCCK